MSWLKSKVAPKNGAQPHPTVEPPPPPPVEPPPAAPEAEVEFASMSLMDHLKELRNRLLWIVVALLVGTLVSMLFANQVIQFIIQPLTEMGAQPTAIGPTDTITVFFKVSLVAGAVLAMPVIVYQIIRFIAPGLYPHEKRLLVLILPGIMVLFAIGACFAYFLLLPAAVAFLQNFMGNLILQTWTIDRYIEFVTRIVFWIGVCFEMPLVIAFLARTGIVSGPQMLRYWRHAVVIAAIVAAIITPTIDPVNMTIVTAPLIGLYAFSVGVAYAVYKPRVARDFATEDFIPKQYKD